jgi:molybdenum cofactor cytidylyltransferase
MKSSPSFFSHSAALIPAAGLSGRMGVLKPLLFFDEKSTFAEKLVETYLQAGVQKVVLVLNPETAAWFGEKKRRFHPARVAVVVNPHPEKGRFHSIRMGLEKLTDFRAVFLQNIDNPFVEEDVLQGLAECFEDGGFVVPQYNGRGGHPVLLSREIVRAISHTQPESQNLRHFLRDYPKIVYRTENPGVLININTPEEYKRYFGRLPAAPEM